MKNEKIEVYLQYPWSFRDSNYYKRMVENPPKKVFYLNANKSGENTTNRKKLEFSNSIKRILRMPFQKLNLSLPNAKKTKIKQNYDLIHCAHCLSLNKSPWVADFESAWQFFLSTKADAASKKRVEKILLKTHCKKIMPWTEKTKSEMQKMFPKKEIKEKLEVVTYALPPTKTKKKKDDEVNLLYVSRYFYPKGGFQTLKAFDIITKNYDNVNATFISSIPGEIFQKYKENKKITLLEMQPWKEIYYKIMPNSDIFVNPGFSDTFGFLFIEALANGLPIVTVDGYARTELINKKQGFVLNRPKIGWNKGMPLIKNEGLLIQKMTDKISLLIENKTLRKRMALAARKEIIDGKFSLKNKNEKLRRIYEESIE